jgi:hypothetical protein
MNPAITPLTHKPLTLRMIKPVFLFLSGAILAASTWAQDRTTTADLTQRGSPALTQEELVALIVGNTLRHAKIQGSQKLDMLYKETGTRVFYSGAANIGMRFEGWYRIKDGKRCEQSSGGGHEVCFTLHKIDHEKYYVCDAKGQCDWTLTAVRGNPLGIQ